MLGPAISADFVLEEGQVVVFVLRQVKEWEYASKEHQNIANPKPERAESLGVSLETLVHAASQLRPQQNPTLTKVSPAKRK